MKHGDKAKAKSAKTVSKASDKKSGSGKAKAAESRESKTGQRSKAPQNAKGGEKQNHVKAGDAAKRAAGGASRGSDASEAAVSFGNPVIAAAFKRAVKKYPNAFRRLTD